MARSEARPSGQWHMHGRSVPTSCTCCGHIAGRAAAVGCAVGSCRKRPFVANVSCLVVGAVMVNETEGVGRCWLPAAPVGERVESERGLRQDEARCCRDPELCPTRETAFTEVTDTAAAVDDLVVAERNGALAMVSGGKDHCYYLALLLLFSVCYEEKLKFCFV